DRRVHPLRDRRAPPGRLRGGLRRRPGGPPPLAPLPRLGAGALRRGPRPIHAADRVGLGRGPPPGVPPEPRVPGLLRRHRPLRRRHPGDAPLRANAGPERGGGV
ncbi:MAG: Hemoglobin-like protein HbO, partial [uncultured Thermomicrobiales bacterium]